MASKFLLLALLALFASQALASDPSQLQDFCVADKNSPVIVNGFVCKNPMDVTPNDFFFPGLNVPRNTDNKLGSNVTLVNVMKLAGLNTLDISVARLDFAPNGLRVSLQALTIPRKFPEKGVFAKRSGNMTYMIFLRCPPSSFLPPGTSLLSSSFLLAAASSSPLSSLLFPPLRLLFPPSPSRGLISGACIKVRILIRQYLELALPSLFSWTRCLEVKCEP